MIILSSGYESVILKTAFIKNSSAQIKILSIISLDRMSLHSRWSFLKKKSYRLFYFLILCTHSLIHYSPTLHSFFYPLWSGFSLHSTTPAQDHQWSVLLKPMDTFRSLMTQQHSTQITRPSWTLFSLGVLLTLAALSQVSLPPSSFLPLQWIPHHSSLLLYSPSWWSSHSFK